MTRIKSLATISALALTLTGNIYAHYHKQTSNQFVTIPEGKPGPEISFTALALKPSASNLNYVIFNKELPAESPTWDEKEIRPGYAFAFELAARYLFTEGRDISLTWTHLNTSSTASTDAPSDSYFLGPDYEIGPAGVPIRRAVGEAVFKYDVINLDGAQTIDFGKNFSLRFFGGISTAFLREQVNTTYRGTTPAPFDGPFFLEQQVTANFNGAGPRFGIGGNYNLPNGFGILGEAAVSGLIGSTYSKTAFTSSAQELKELFDEDINKQYIKDQNVTQVIPGFDAKLGLSYQHVVGKDMVLSVKAGYQAAVYVNAISQYLPGKLVSGAPLESGGIFVATMAHTLSNYSVQGPFLEGTLFI